MRYAYLRTGVEDGFITGETADAVMAYMNAIEAAKQITDDIDARYKAFCRCRGSAHHQRTGHSARHERARLIWRPA